MRRNRSATHVLAGFATMLALGAWAGAHGCSGGGTNETPSDAAVSDVLPATCSGAYCDSLLGPYCDRFWRECTGSVANYDGPNHDVIRKSCIDSMAWALGLTPGEVSSKAQQLSDCVAKAKDCVAMNACAKKFAPPSDASVDPEEVVGPPGDAGLLQDVVALPSDVVTIPGDDPGCVKCAISQCPTESQYCFVDPASTPGCYAAGSKYPDPTDCCADYRRCIASCETVDPAGGATFLQCLTTGCDTDLPKGKSQFAAYQTCVEAKCAGCWGDAGP